jgi:hypothetical protein
MPNIAVTVTKIVAMRPIQRSRRVTTRESRNVISVASAIGTNTVRPKYSTAITNAKSRSAQIPFNAATELSGERRVRMRQAISRLQPGLIELAIANLPQLTEGAGTYGTLLPLQPKKKKITHITRNRKNKNLAIPADAAAIPPNPSSAAISAIIRKVTAQPNIVSPRYKRIVSINCGGCRELSYACWLM